MKGKHRTKEEINNAVKIYLEGHTIKETSEITGIGTACISRAIEEREVKRDFRFLNATVDEVIDAYFELESIQQVAKKFNVSTAFIYSILRREEVVTKRSYISQQRRRKIKESILKGLTPTEIAKQLNITRQAVSQCVKKLRLSGELPESKKYKREGRC